MKKLLVVLLSSIGMAYAATPAPSYGTMKYYGTWQTYFSYPYGNGVTSVVTYESAGFESGATVQFIAESVPTPGKFPNTDTAWVLQ